MQHGQQQLLRERSADVPRPGAGGGRLLPSLARAGKVAVVVGVVAEVALRLEQQHGVTRCPRGLESGIVVCGRRVAVGQQVVGDPAQAHRGPATPGFVRRLVAQAGRLQHEHVDLARFAAFGPHPIRAVGVADRQRVAAATRTHATFQASEGSVRRRQHGVEGLEPFGASLLPNTSSARSRRRPPSGPANRPCGSSVWVASRAATPRRTRWPGRGRAPLRGRWRVGRGRHRVRDTSSKLFARKHFRDPRRTRQDSVDATSPCGSTSCRRWTRSSSRSSPGSCCGQAPGPGPRGRARRRRVGRSSLKVCWRCNGSARRTPHSRPSRPAARAQPRRAFRTPLSARGRQLIARTTDPNNHSMCRVELTAASTPRQLITSRPGAEGHNKKQPPQRTLGRRGAATARGLPDPGAGDRSGARFPMGG